MKKLNFPRLSGLSVEQQIANCQRKLSEPIKVYPNGQTSHEFETAYLEKLTADLFEHRLHGEFNVDGSFAGY